MSKEIRRLKCRIAGHDDIRLPVLMSPFVFMAFSEYLCLRCNRIASPLGNRITIVSTPRREKDLLKELISDNSHELVMRPLYGNIQNMKFDLEYNQPEDDLELIEEEDE